MKSETKPGPAGGKSRRAFIRKIGTAATASSLAATAGSAQQPAAPGRASEGWAQPGPLSKQPMPTIRLGKHQVGRLVLGINPIGSHFSEVLRRTFHEWNTPEQEAQIFKHCEDLGINLRVQTRDQINQYNKEFGGKMLFTNNSSFPRQPDGTVAMFSLPANWVLRTCNSRNFSRRRRKPSGVT